MQITRDYLKTNCEFKTKEDLFKFIDEQALKKGIIENSGDALKGFIEREAQGTTGFEDGFAIPHARVQGVLEPAIYVVINKNDYDDWTALDGNGVKYTIVLLIPEAAGEFHMEVLSTIATKLMDETFRSTIKKGEENEILWAFNDAFANISNPQKNELTNQNESNKLIIGISACPAGIAHTYMAKQKMEEGAKHLSFNIKWETQGANGQKNTISKEEIEKADVVIIASDIKLDLTRFIGKRVLVTDTNDAIRNGDKLITKALNEAKIFNGTLKHGNHLMNFFKKYKLSFQSSFGTPWVYMSTSATILAIISLIGFTIYGTKWSTEHGQLNSALYSLQVIAQFALSLSMPFMAATVAKKMNDKSEVWLTVFVSTLLVNVAIIIPSVSALNGMEREPVSLLWNWNDIFEDKYLSHGSNVFGAIFTTFFSVLVFNLINSLKVKIRQTKIAFVERGISPWLGTTIPSIVVIFGVVYLLGAPLSYVSYWFTYLLFEYGNQYWWARFIIGGFLGSLIAFDLGGFINKSALIALIGLAQYDLRFAAIISVGIPLASIGFGTSFAIFKNRFKEEDKEEAGKSFRKGLNGMTEGPLFATNKYGIRMSIPNLLSTFVATGLAMVLGLYIFKGGHLGILYLGAQGHLAQVNDIKWLNYLLWFGREDGGTWYLPLTSIVYGIIGYYTVMLIGCVTYVATSFITFSFAGKNRVFR